MDFQTFFIVLLYFVFKQKSVHSQDHKPSQICMNEFDRKSTIHGGRLASISEESVKESSNGIFCALKERTVIFYFHSKAEEVNKDDNVNWKEATCFDNNTIAFKQVAQKMQSHNPGDPWTFEKYYVSIICYSTAPIRFEFIGSQPVTEIITTSDYHAQTKRFIRVVFIPYSWEKTGNYTFQTIDSEKSSFDWFFIYFERNSPPYLIKSVTEEPQDNSAYFDPNNSTYVIIPCRTTNPEETKRINLRTICSSREQQNEYSRVFENLLDEFYNPATGFHLSQKSYSSRVCSKDYDNEVGFKQLFQCSLGDQDTLNIEGSIYQVKNVSSTNIKISISSTSKQTVYCSYVNINMSKTPDYLANIFLPTSEESFLLKNCLNKKNQCPWNSPWDVKGVQVTEKLLNKKENKCTMASDGHTYPCALFAPYKSGMFLCSLGEDSFFETYFTGLDNNIYFLSQWKNAPKDALALVTIINENGPLYASQSYTFQCTGLFFVFHTGFTWTIYFKNGSQSDVTPGGYSYYVSRNRKENYELDPQNIGVNVNSATITLSSSEINEIECGMYPRHSQVMWKTKLKLEVKEKMFPRIKATGDELNLTISPKDKNPLLSCIATGVPTPKLIWSKDNKVFSTGVYQFINESISQTRLDLRFSNKINPLKVGNYVCSAENTEGIVNATFHIDIQDEIVDGNLLKIVGLSVGLPSAALIVIALVVAYKIRQNRKMVLTKEDIYTFIRGIQTEPESGNQELQEMHHYRVLPYNKEREVVPKAYEIDYTSILGSGAFGLVLKGKLHDTDVAVKTVKPETDRETILSLLDEIKIMIYLGHHPHIVELLGANTKDLAKGQIYLFVELCPSGSVKSYLKDNKNSFIPKTPQNGYENIPVNRNTILNNLQLLDLWSYQMAKGMKYLSQQNVIHGDLATRNILLLNLRHLKITDFGLSRQLKNYSIYKKTQNQPLPWRWMAPETLAEMEFSVKSDVWSFGVTLWEIYSLGSVPYPGLEWTPDFVKVRLERGLQLGSPSLAPLKICNIMKRCWTLDPKSRPDFVELEAEMNICNTSENIEYLNVIEKHSSASNLQ